jgi:hypothetical protein
MALLTVVALDRTNRKSYSERGFPLAERYDKAPPLPHGSGGGYYKSLYRNLLWDQYDKCDLVRKHRNL